MDNIEILKQLSVLYVEDDTLIRKGVVRLLRRRCNEIFEAENGKVGLEMYMNYNPDIVITDIEMPVMNGLEMLERIFEHNETQAVIIVTAYNDEEYKHKKSCRVLIKPIINKELTDAIVSCYKGSR